MRLSAGTRFGVYQILSSLGEGGMGEVYRARDTRLGRDVAIKVLAEPFTHDPERIARFEREARLLAWLNHPGIGAIYGLEQASPGADQPVIPALILELVEGDTLAERIRRGPIPPAVALEIARQIAEALDFAHERGIVHRDLKPANIKITAGDAVKLLDFGLAKTLVPDIVAAPAAEPPGSPTITSQSTRAGVILGTPAYMSPEQARGHTPLDKRVDIWAFGCVLYEMLSGTQAFKGDSFVDTIAAVVQREPDLSRIPATTPAAVRRLLQRCLQKDVRRRLRDIADARVEIEEAIANPTLGDPATTPPALVPPRRSPWLTGSLILFGLGAAAGVGWLVGRRQETAPAPTFDRLIRLVSTAAHEFGPAVSPDGKWVAYLSTARGPTDVWVKFIAGGDPINLTASAGLTVQSLDSIGGLAVSPDGSQIAFQAQSERQQLGGTWVIPGPLGGPPRRALPTGNSGMQWSFDGKRIAYVKTGGPLGDALMVADADGQNEVEIVKRQGAWHVHWVRWDPAGQFVYFNYGFQNMNSEPTQVFRVPASGGPVERIVATARRATSPFPYGQGLFYAANPDGVDLSLWWKHLASGRDYRVTTGVGEYGSPAMSADGQRLVGTVSDVRRSLERVAVTFDRPATLEPLTDGFSGDVDPAWSPDGAQLVFSSSRTGNRALWTARGDLTQPAPLTSAVALDDRPVYSPDGRQVAFVSDRGGRRGIWLVSAEVGTPRLIAAADVIDTISWSPDGRRLVFSTPLGDAPGLMTMDVTSGQTTPVPTAAAATTPAWSPHDDVIAYIEPRGGGIGAFLKFVRSSGEVVDKGDVVQKVNVSNGFASWSPDGTRLAVMTQPGAFNGAIWILDLKPEPAFRKLLELTPGVLLRGATWSRDGSSLIVGRIQSSGDIFLAERSARPAR